MPLLSCHKTTYFIINMQIIFKRLVQEILLLLLPLQPMGFSLLNPVILGFCVSKSWIKFFSLSFFKSFITSSLHLFCGCPLVLTPMGSHSVIFLTSFISSMEISVGYFAELGENVEKMANCHCLLLQLTKHGALHTCPHMPLVSRVSEQTCSIH